MQGPLAEHTTAHRDTGIVGPIHEDEMTVVHYLLISSLLLEYDNMVLMY